MKFGMLHLFESPMGRSEEQMLKEQIALMQAAEDLGFDSVWLAERHFSEYGFCASPAVVLAAVARTTRRIRRKLGAARLLCWRAAWLADRQHPNVLEASMTKAVAPTAAFEATQVGIELLREVGARGDHLIEKLFRDVKAMDIVEGTGKVQRLVMAHHLVNLPSERGS